MFGRMHVLPVVTSFLAAYPDVSVGLMLTDKVTHFLDDQIDVALRIGYLPDSELVAVRLGAVRRVICASPSYLSTRGTPATPDELPEHSVVSFESVSSTSNWKFWSGGSDFNVPFRSRLSVNTIEAAIDAGLAGSGLIRTMSYQIAEYVRRGDLQIVLSEFEPPVRPVHLVYDKKNRLPLKLRAFIDFVVPRLRDLLHSTTTLIEHYRRYPTQPVLTGRGTLRFCCYRGTVAGLFQLQCQKRRCTSATASHDAFISKTGGAMDLEIEAICGDFERGTHCGISLDLYGFARFSPVTIYRNDQRLDTPVSSRCSSDIIPR